MADFSRDVGADAQKRIRVSAKADHVLIQEVTALGPSGVFAPAGRGISVPLADVNRLLECLHAAREAGWAGGGEHG